MTVSTADFMLSTLATALGAVIQGISGVGGGFIMVPLLAMIDVSLLPGPFVFSTIFLSGLMAWRERAHINYKHTAYLMAAIIPGSLLGAWLLAGIPTDSLGILFGGLVLLAVLISLLGVHFPLTPFSGVVSGLAAGAMGATVGIGAPVIAILYQRVSGPAVRSTLAFIYTVSSVFILCSLAAFGRFGIAEMQSGVLLVPGLMLGLLLARPLALKFDHGATRYIVLGVSALAALILIVSSW
ncbi:MAG: sulfite exporter TauE/SafE family protein [Gammaproteobacteria bacterium]